MTKYPESVIRFAKAIAVAEGSNPAWQNPGDLTFADGFPTCGFANSEGVLKFISADDGWQALYHQCWLMLTGRSHVYQLTDTLGSVGLRYSNGDVNWAVNVAKVLGVTTQTTLQQIASEENTAK